MSKVLEGLKYSKDHEWVRMDGDIAVVGITEYAEKELGDIVYVELPEEGAEFAAGDEIASIESVKAASAIINPVGGKVCAVNEELDGAAETVNDDAYEAWIYKLENVNKADLDSLMDKAGYEAYLATL